MDLEKNIEIAFGVYWKNLPVTTELNTGTHLEAFITGAKSQAAKDFWYNEFKHEIEVGIVRKLHSEGKCGYVSTEELTDQEKLDIEYGITPLGRQHRQYLKDNPDKPMSFDDWKYMIENYKGESSNIIHKHIGVIGHVDHGKSIIVGETGVDDRIVASAHNIQSIVPIADIIPEEIISKQEFLKMHDKAVERSITEETYKESRAWDIKKEKKVSHKRNNKRK